MNPALFLIVFIALIALWFLLSFVFRPLGRFIYRIYKDAIDEMNKEENNNKNKEDKENE